MLLTMFAAALTRFRLDLPGAMLSVLLFIGAIYNLLAMRWPIVMFVFVSIPVTGMQIRTRRTNVLFFGMTTFLAICVYWFYYSDKSWAQLQNGEFVMFCCTVLCLIISFVTSHRYAIIKHQQRQNAISERRGKWEIIGFSEWAFIGSDGNVMDEL